MRQLLGHEAGLVLLDEKLTIEKLRDLDYMARLLARQKPAWLVDDPREKPLREAVYRAIRRLGVRPRAVDSSGAPNLSGAALASPL